MLGLTACGDKVSEGTNEELVTSISVNKDGSIESKIVEAFGESYYDVSDLRAMIEEAVSDYSKQAPTSEISLKGCDVSDSVVTVEMKFNDYNAYAGFNNENFFAGTIQAAYEAGYDLNMTLNAVSSKEGSATVSKQELLSMGDNHIVILEKSKLDEEGKMGETIRVNCYNEILYVGDGVSAVGKKSADISLAEGLGIVVFK